MVNKCEMEYLKCHPGTHATEVPLKYCDHTPKPEMTEASIRKKRALMITQQDLSEEDTHTNKKEKKHHNQEALSEVLKSVIKETKQKIAKKTNKNKKSKKKVEKSTETEESKSHSEEYRPINKVNSKKTLKRIVHNEEYTGRNSKEVIKGQIQRIIHKADEDVPIRPPKTATTTTISFKRTTKPLRPIPGVERGRVIHNAREKKPNAFDRPYRGAIIKKRRQIARKYGVDYIQKAGPAVYENDKTEQDGYDYGESNDDTNDKYVNENGNADGNYYENDNENEKDDADNINENNDYAQPKSPETEELAMPSDYDETLIKNIGHETKDVDEEQYDNANNPADDNDNLDNDENKPDYDNNYPNDDNKNPTDDNNNPDNYDNPADDENYLISGESQERQGRELIPDYNKLIFPHHYDDDTDENAQQEEFNSDCPKACPARVMMVCARCKHGIHRTFLSICHMRMFACAKGKEHEGLQLVSREPCAVSAPHLGSPGEYPAGHVREPSDQDAILQFIHFNMENNKKNEPLPDLFSQEMY